MLRDPTVLHAPSPLGLKPPAEGHVPGVWRMPAALERAGLHAALGARTAGEVTPPPYVPDVDPALGVRNPGAIRAYSLALADRTGALLDGGDFPMVLGGDCSILLGTALALRRRGRFGLLYVDAHPDCLTPDTTATGGVAGMPLAIVTGTGPAPLADLEGRRPYVRESDARVVGCRDPFQVVPRPPPRHREDGTRPKRVEGTAIGVHDLDDVRRTGPAETARATLASLLDEGVEGAWVHFDVDALDDAVMPAVDSPMEGGLSPDEAVDLLAPWLASPRVVGLQVTIYDPERDPGGDAARVLVDVLARAFREAGGGGGG